MQNLSFFLEKIPTPLGLMLMLTDENEAVRAIDWQDYESRMQQLIKRQYKQLSVQWQPRQTASKARQAIEGYFAGDIRAIDNLPVVQSGTEFQREVWRALRAIPAGQTRSYAALAENVNRPKAVRAVGAANGANLVAVVVPCHRVIGSNQRLTGYAGGLERKQWLLAHEAKYLDS